jgi:hypothetical protein
VMPKKPRSRATATEDACGTESEQLVATAATVARGQSALAHADVLRHRYAELSKVYRDLAVDRERLSADVQRNREALMATAHAYGACLQDDGVAPEHIVTSVRNVLGVLLQTSAEQDCAPEELVSEVITWAIQGYYRSA